MDRPFAVYKNEENYYIWYSNDPEKGLIKKEGKWFDDVEKSSVLTDFTDEHQSNIKKGYQQVVAWYRPSTGETIPHC